MCWAGLEGHAPICSSLRPDPYTDYLLCWELFYCSMEAVLAADPSYRRYFVAEDNQDFARFQKEPRFKAIAGE